MSVVNHPVQVQSPKESKALVFPTGTGRFKSKPGFGGIKTSIRHLGSLSSAERCLRGERALLTSVTACSSPFDLAQTTAW